MLVSVFHIRIWYLLQMNAHGGYLLVNVQMSSSVDLVLTGLQFSDEESEGSGEEEADTGDGLMVCNSCML